MPGFVKDLLSGDIPRCHLLLQSRWITMEKAQGMGWPVSIREAFLRLSSFCALSTAQNTSYLLAPLQIGVGMSGGAEIPEFSLRARLLQPRGRQRPG